MLVRVDNQNRNHRATVHVAVVHSSRDRLSSESHSVVASRREPKPPRRTRSLRPDKVDTEHSKCQVP
jgi:hypothetical protein